MAGRAAFCSIPPTLVRPAPVRGCTECGTPLPPATPRPVAACEMCRIPLLLTAGGLTVAETPLRETDWVAPGGALAGYRIGQRMGVGSNGSVFVARQLESGRIVALKFLKQQPNPLERERFYREGNMVSKCQHPRVVQINQMGSFEGHPFIVMEAAAGNLKQVLKNQVALPVRHIVDIGLQLCAGIAYLHQMGIIHRDIKPENVLVTRHSTHSGAPDVQLGDLGVAGPDLTSASPEEVAIFAGTPAYMAPEQFRGHYSPASDVYALGVLLLELFTGQPPLTDSQLRDLIAAKQLIPLNDLKAVHRRAGELMARLLARCLDPKPAKRPDLATVERVLASEAAARGLTVGRVEAPVADLAQPVPPASRSGVGGLANLPGPDATALKALQTWLGGLPLAWKAAVYALIAVWSSVFMMLLATH